MSESSKRSGGGGGGGCGCLSLIIFGFVVWALVFGVTVGGEHYSIGCSCDRGVDVSRSAR